MKRAIVLIIMAVTLTLGVYGCKKSETKPATSTQAATAINLPLMNSEEFVRIKDENKGKIIIFNFFASWCPPCIDEMPDFVNTYNEFKDKNFLIVGISGDENMADALKFAEKFNIKFPMYMADRALEKKYMVSKYPTNLIYDKEGKLLRIVNGAMTGADIKAVAELGSE